MLAAERRPLTGWRDKGTLFPIKFCVKTSWVSINGRRRLPCADVMD